VSDTRRGPRPPRTPAENEGHMVRLDIKRYTITRQIDYLKKLGYYWSPCDDSYQFWHFYDSHGRETRVGDALALGGLEMVGITDDDYFYND
jgi:hypothetical protein